MNRFAAASPRSRYPYVAAASSLLLTLALSAAALDAGAAEPLHGWGRVAWGMTEAQVESTYGEDVEKRPTARNRRTEIVESLRLKNPVVINGVALAQSFVFSQTDKGLDRVILRANLSDVSSAVCQGAYRKIRQSEVDQMKEPIEEKPAIRSMHARWHGTAADAQLSVMEVPGRCFLTLVFKRPDLTTAPSDEPTDRPADQHDANSHEH
jgi:hypothetical protein